MRSGCGRAILPGIPLWSDPAVPFSSFQILFRCSCFAEYCRTIHRLCCYCSSVAKRTSTDLNVIWVFSKGTRYLAITLVIDIFPLPNLETKYNGHSGSFSNKGTSITHFLPVIGGVGIQGGSDLSDSPQLGPHKVQYVM